MGANFYDYSYNELLWRGIEVHRGEEDVHASQEFNFPVVVDSRQFLSDIIFGSEKQMREVDQWCQDNLMGFFKIDTDRSSFEYEDDAMAFKLMWTE